MEAAALAWRRLWRSIGLAVDRLLPLLYVLPAPTLEEAEQAVLSSVTVPGDVKRYLSNDEQTTVLDAANFFVGFIAERLPVQVLATDLKPLLPKLASTLAVSREVNGEKEYLGSYDFLLRVHASSGLWQAYNLQEMVLDVKVTGVARPLGVNSPTMLTILAHGHAVMTAASKQARNRIGACRLVAYLLRRPPGKTFHGKDHEGSWALLVFDKRVLLIWTYCISPYGLIAKDISICKTPATIRGGGSLQARKGATQSGSHGRPRGKYTITKFGAERRARSYRRRCFMNVGVSKIFNTASVYCRALAVVIATSKRRIAVIITAIITAITAMGIKSRQHKMQNHWRTTLFLSFLPTLPSPRGGSSVGLIRKTTGQSVP